MPSSHGKYEPLLKGNKFPLSATFTGKDRNIFREVVAALGENLGQAVFQEGKQWAVSTVKAFSYERALELVAHIDGVEVHRYDRLEVDSEKVMGDLAGRDWNHRTRPGMVLPKQHEHIHD